MALGECSASGVLAGESDQFAFGQERSQRQQFAECPVDLAFVGHLPALLHHWFDPRVHSEALRCRQVRIADTRQHRLFHRGGHTARDHLGGLHRLARLDLVLLQFANFVEHLLELTLIVTQGVLGFFHRDIAAADQGLGVGLAGPTLGVDHLVHGRVCHRRVVTLVVAAAAVAQHVDDDVLVEGLAEVDRQPGHPDARLRVITVDVEYRCTCHLRDVGAVLGRSGILRSGGEADLVVDDDVDGPAGAVTPQQRQVQCFGHHALAGEGGVSMHHHRHHAETARVLLGAVDKILLGAHQALQHRVHGLQV